MNYYIEWASDVKKRKGLMVTLPALARIVGTYNPGYSSVYMFKEDDAKAIRLNGHSRGFNQYEVAAQFLVIDCDKGEDGRARIEHVLQAKGLSYEMWVSGGKGYHFYIPHALVVDKRLPYSHKAAALALFSKDDIDLTLYQHGRLISLPGRIHPVTRKRKTLIKTVKGQPLDLKIVDEPSKVIGFNVAELGDHVHLVSGFQRAADLITLPPDRGSRHIRLWGVALDFAMAGLDYDTVLSLLSKVNDTWEDPKEQEELVKAVQGAFRRIGLEPG